jgi:Histidine kinase-, DNA gyrase B-, and HSP90-like ATPase
MAITHANAFPRKRFFLEMFTRDISLEDCILDLIDNSIDSLVRSREINPAADILRHSKPPRPGSELPLISVTLNEREVTILDNCGGIPLKLLENEVFSFGHDKGATLGQLGAYGIGLKRAMFKIGEEFEIFSKTSGSGFSAKVNVDEWAENDSELSDWTIPITERDEGLGLSEPGTRIHFLKLRDEVRMRIRDGAFLGRLTNEIARTYALFLETYVRVEVNGEHVEPMAIPLGTSSQITPGQVEFSKGEVKVRIIAALASRRDSEWAYERAGWYVMCNGRVVLAADKSEMTGWGEGLPRFHSKYNGFVGLAVFRSRNPLALPWTTTKRGLHRESPVFQSARIEMMKLARPIISFLNGMYPGSLFEQPVERQIAEKVVHADLRNLARKKPAPVHITKPANSARAVTKVCYDASPSDLERARKALREPKWSANKIGRFTFDHYLRTECPE